MMVRIHPNCPNENPISAPAKEGDVGYDLKVWLDFPRTIEPQSMVNVRTGVFIKLPDGCWGNIRPRSSTFAKRQLFVMGGTIDEGYTGEISVFIWNPGPEPCEIENGDRLAQLIVAPRLTPEINLVTDLPETKRGGSGFGSTGD
jgi:dUTP pyrophosphatase